MVKYRSNLLFLFIVILSCKQIKNEASVTFHLIDKPPFALNMESDKIELDSTMTITLIDANRNGEFTDSIIPCDYINIGNTLFRQSKGAVFKSIINFNYGVNGYSLIYNKFKNTGQLKLNNKKYSDPEIYIFTELPDFKVISKEDTTNQTYFKNIINSIDSLDYKYVLLEFWAPSCSSCIEGMNYYNSNNQLFDEVGLKIVYVAHISYYSESLYFLSKHFYDFAFYFVNPNISEMLNCEGYPNGILMSINNEYLGHFGFASPSDVVSYLKNIN